jgi:WD40 repeat protein
MRGNILVSGGSEGSVRVWSLETMAPIHKMEAHEHSVVSLQSDDSRIVSGGSDGRVRVWDLKTGQLVRELTGPADAAWLVAFEEEKFVLLASRLNQIILEVCIGFIHFEKNLTSSGLVILSASPYDARECSQWPSTTPAQQNWLRLRYIR